VKLRTVLGTLPFPNGKELLVSWLLKLGDGGQSVHPMKRRIRKTKIFYSKGDIKAIWL